MGYKKDKRSIWQKIHIDIPLLFMILLILGYGLITLWSASGQNIEMMERRLIQCAIALGVMIFFAQIPPRIYENWAIYLYVISVILLIIVDLYGESSKGAQRWLNLGFVRFQPSEIAKIAIPLMVASFINRNTFPPNLLYTIGAMLIIFIPTLLIALEPDLGTAILVAISGLFVIFLGGLSWIFILIAIILVAVSVPVMWEFFMHDYQKTRVLTLFNPEQDPRGAGYHIMQSKIAIGSGGINGKGLGAGTQSQLEFVPERHTDFIFAVISEEFGYIGVCILLFMYLLLIFRGLMIAAQAQTMFGRVLSGGLTLIFFIYLFVNIGMVSGILPVVGVPLPLISYGGSSLVVLMAAFGIVMSIHTHRKTLSRNV
ncbi:peptidoglycan glycosyltransferase MrdB [Thorsellia anophelis]|uniref:Peptidoglycan glycosyltransferase MrdB n=1 Tax=Thorsellia anophelis DSM 18579 TaxID=1123402 RepID=A0A1I0DUZ7_9GAMM|nr:peptidoglycan glycosyltransferase MrdB [Thorsellia anophelis]SET36448.1 cell elongation-specific peptidoglycan biosynthesis regulator RodA [Thorsellia anophelis DSM 18579]